MLTDQTNVFVFLLDAKAKLFVNSYTSQSTTSECISIITESTNSQSGQGTGPVCLFV